FFQAEDGIRDPLVTGVQTCALPIFKQFDIVVANPMWNQPFDPDVYEHDPFGRFEEQGGTTVGKADWAWLQHTLATMKEGGRAAEIGRASCREREARAGGGEADEDKM